MNHSSSNKSIPGMRILTILILAMAATSATGQPLENEYPESYLKFSVGYTYPITTLETGEITDKLIGFRSRYNYARYSGTRFLNERIGLNFYWQKCYSQEKSGQDASFYDVLTEQYNNDYYFIVHEFPDGPLSTYNRDFSQGYFGLVYRVAKGRFFIHPQLGLGFTSFSTTRAVMRLKEKNSNMYHTIEYNNNKYQNEYFSLAGGVTAGVRLFTRFHLTAECGYSWFRSDFSYTIKQKNLVEGTSSQREISYTRNMHALSIGFGLSYELNYSQIRSY